MKILYGVVGEGMGHATRSHVILQHLTESQPHLTESQQHLAGSQQELAEGHKIKIVASGKAHEYLKMHHPDIEEIGGYGFAFNEGGVDLNASLKKLLNEIPKKAPHNLKKFFKLSQSFKPDVIISDFESFAYLFGKYNHVPVISIDNMQVLNRCRLDVDIPFAQMEDYVMAKGLVKAKLPGCYHYLVTTFFYPEITKPDTTLHPPILRPEILNAEATRKGHVLVYQTSKSNPELLDILARIDRKFIVYGFGEGQAPDNVVLKKISHEEFIHDLASANAVIASAGFSLIGEALYLKKPYLAVPLARQFEQMLNAKYLRKLGYGDFCERLTPEAISNFLKNLGQYETALADYSQEGNTLILNKLDKLLEEIADRK